MSFVYTLVLFQYSIAAPLRRNPNGHCLLGIDNAFPLVIFHSSSPSSLISVCLLTSCIINQKRVFPICLLRLEELLKYLVHDLVVLSFGCPSGRRSDDIA